MENALVLAAEEGRERLRKATGSCQEALIRRNPNGGTHWGKSLSIHR